MAFESQEHMHMRVKSARPPTLIISLLAITWLIAGCGSSSPPPSTVAHIGAAKPTSASTSDTAGLPGAGRAANFQRLVRFSQCMRSHGEPSFPDPQRSGNAVGLTLHNFNPHSPQFQAAQKACASLAPPGIASGASPAKLREQLVAFAACMRSHGVPNYPDPTVKVSGGPGHGKVAIHIGGPGLDPNSPQVAHAQQACHTLLPGGGP